MHATLPLLKQTDFPPLYRAALDTLQVNLGYRCNQACLHCHVNASPDRKEMMARETVEQVLDVLRTRQLATLDLTGGAPELNPHFRHLDLPCGEEPGEILEAGLVQDREVAAVDDPESEGARLLHQPPEVRVQLRRAAGDVQRGDAARPQHREDLVDRLRRHHLPAVGARVDVAVQAGLVAAVAEVDLQRIDGAPGEGREVGLAEQRQRRVHGLPRADGVRRCVAGVAHGCAFARSRRLRSNTGTRASSPSSTNAPSVSTESRSRVDSMRPSVWPRFTNTNVAGMMPRNVASA